MRERWWTLQFRYVDHMVWRLMDAWAARRRLNPRHRHRFHHESSMLGYDGGEQIFRRRLYRCACGKEQEEWA